MGVNIIIGSKSLYVPTLGYCNKNEETSYNKICIFKKHNVEQKNPCAKECRVDDSSV